MVHREVLAALTPEQLPGLGAAGVLMAFAFAVLRTFTRFQAAALAAASDEMARLRAELAAAAEERARLLERIEELERRSR